MSPTLQKLAGQLADDTMAAMKETGNDRLYVEIGDFLGASSQTLEEAYLTEVRVRLAEIGARQFLNKKLAEFRAGAQKKAPESS
ncbi:hypothetical protein ACXYMO_01895 [Arenibacterium sp. CAU 1754]